MVEVVNSQLFEGLRSWYWVADEVGGICDFGDTDFLNTQEMALILENNMTYDDYVEWREANLENEKYINLKSWIMGARHQMINQFKT